MRTSIKCWNCGLWTLGSDWCELCGHARRCDVFGVLTKLPPAPQIVLTDEQAKHILAIPKTYPDGTGSLTPFEWVEWAKTQLLYGDSPLKK